MDKGAQAAVPQRGAGHPRRDGEPPATTARHPVCHVEFKGRIYWASDPDTAKVANLSRRRTVALVADIYKAGWRDMGGVMAQGRAKLIREGPLFRRIRTLLYRKFKVYRSNAPLEERESVIIEVTPSRLVSWWYE